MNGEPATSSLTDDELLARFILFKRYIRDNGRRVAPEAFVPHPTRELSVKRHLGLTEAELWGCGQEIADRRPATLYGRADVQVVAVTRQSLRCVATRTPRNHVNIVGWPAEKPAQKVIAMALAGAAAYTANPAAPPTPA